MFTHIRTSKRNREVISRLTHKLNLGAENVISRIALMYSISKDRKMDLSQIQNSGGKEYTKGVLFGEHLDYYLAMIAHYYALHISDRDLPKYIKMHIDDGLELLEAEYNQNSNLDGFEFLIDRIDLGIQSL